MFSTPISRKASTASAKGEAQPQMPHRANGRKVSQSIRNPAHAFASSETCIRGIYVE